MAEIDETPLPGVGVRHDFVTSDGVRIGLLSHVSGRRELLVYDRGDPDSCREVVELNEEDVRVLGELLGADHVSERLTGLRQSVHGITIDWLPLEESWAHARATLGDADLPGRSGAVPVAVVRDERTVPAPPPDFALRPGDVLVVVGTGDGIRAALELLRGG